MYLCVKLTLLGLCTTTVHAYYIVGYLSLTSWNGGERKSASSLIHRKLNASSITR